MNIYAIAALAAILAIGAYKTGHGIVWLGHKIHHGIGAVVRHQGKPKSDISPAEREYLRSLGCEHPVRMTADLIACEEDSPAQGAPLLSHPPEPVPPKKGESLS